MSIEESIPVEVGELTLLPGDGLLVYSDGVVENLWATGEQGRPSVLAAIREQLEVFRHAFLAHDDLSMIWFRRKIG